MTAVIPSNPSTCAACNGDLLDKSVNTVWWENHAVDLCDACLTLGAVEGDLLLNPEDIEELWEARANPRAPRTNIEPSVRRWIASNNR